MGHKYPDMDAMGAAVGIYDICKSCNKTANIVLDHSNESIEEFIKKLKDQIIMMVFLLIVIMQ